MIRLCDSLVSGVATIFFVYLIEALTECKATPIEMFIIYLLVLTSYYVSKLVGTK